MMLQKLNVVKSFFGAKKEIVKIKHCGIEVNEHLVHVQRTLQLRPVLTSNSIV